MREILIYAILIALVVMSGPIIIYSIAKCFAFGWYHGQHKFNQTYHIKESPNGKKKDQGKA